MPKPIKFTYEKKDAHKDASYFIIVCEGENREPDYYKFFVGVSSRVKLVPVECNDGRGNPRALIDNAFEKEKNLDIDVSIDRVWFVIDTDRWREQIHELRGECEKHINWKVSQSNPCFEVWLYFHAKANKVSFPNFENCNAWKPLLPTIIKGGFNSDMHPIEIERATENSKKAYEEEGYLPKPGSTQLWQLGEELINIIKKDLDDIKHLFPSLPVIH